MVKKAFAVLETDENTGGIIFAEHDIVARRLGANDFADGNLAGVTCRRAPWADSFLDKGDVPCLVMIENGWHFDCHGCGQYIDSEFEGHNENDEPIELEPVEDGNGLFCAASCREQHLRTVSEQKIYSSWIADLMATLCLQAMPGAAVTSDVAHVYAVVESGIWTAQEACISFDFPGQTIRAAQFRFDRHNRKPYALVCAGDQRAFEAWRAAGYPSKMV